MASPASHNICAECGGEASPPIPLGKLKDPCEDVYCLSCIAAAVEAVTGWKVRKTFYHWLRAKQIGEALAGELSQLPD